MKKYITPQIECFDFEVCNIIASSLNSNEDLNKPVEGGWEPGMEAQGRENNNNSNMWNSGW